jgi:hypothetical protein
LLMMRWMVCVLSPASSAGKADTAAGVLWAIAEDGWRRL